MPASRKMATDGLIGQDKPSGRSIGCNAGVLDHLCPPCCSVAARHLVAADAAIVRHQRLMDSLECVQAGKPPFGVELADLTHMPGFDHDLTTGESWRDYAQDHLTRTFHRDGNAGTSRRHHRGPEFQAQQTDSTSRHRSCRRSLPYSPPRSSRYCESAGFSGVTEPCASGLASTRSQAASMSPRSSNAQRDWRLDLPNPRPEQSGWSAANGPSPAAQNRLSFLLAAISYSTTSKQSPCTVGFTRCIEWGNDT